MAKNMDSKKIFEKFGDYYLANEDTFMMGIDLRITSKIAERFKNKNVLETCTGAGFTTISLAKYANKVISIDINKENQDQAKHNLMMSGNENKVDFILGNSLDENILKQASNINAAFLDPDWAILDDNHVYKFKNSNTKPKSDLLFHTIYKITKNIALILPPFVNEDELSDLPANERQKIHLDGELALICIYFGDLIQKNGETNLFL